MKIICQVALESGDDEKFSVSIGGETLTPENNVVFIDPAKLQPKQETQTAQ